MTGTEITTQIKTALNLVDGRSKNSKLGFEFVSSNIEHLTSNGSVAFRAREMNYGIMWAYRTGRLIASVETTIRTMNALRFTQLIGEVSDNCSTANEIPQWLNSNL